MKTPKTLPYWTVTAAAREVGANKQTLHAAVRRGGINSYVTEDGTPLVRLPDVERWWDARHDRKPGRKPAT